MIESTSSKQRGKLKLSARNINYYARSDVSNSRRFIYRGVGEFVFAENTWWRELYIKRADGSLIVSARVQYT